MCHIVNLLLTLSIINSIRQAGSAAWQTEFELQNEANCSGWAMTS